MVDRGLLKSEANYRALSPIQFLDWAAGVFPDRKSVIYGDRSFTWADTHRRCTLFASALLSSSISAGDTVSVLAPNVPAMYEAQFGIPMAGAILNGINIRLDANTISFLLGHSESKAILFDQELFSLVEESLSLLASAQGSAYKSPLLVVIEDPKCNRESLVSALAKGAIEYENFLYRGDANFKWVYPSDEWETISICYTSGTTSDPKGVVMSHRSGYLSALMGCLMWGLTHGCVYLWTLPLFHCNGWCYSWAIAAMAGTNICLRQVTATDVYSSIVEYGVTHFCAAPVVLNTILNASDDERKPIKAGVQVMTAGAAPPQSVLAKMEGEGFKVAHTYGLTETAGPCTICAWKPEWDDLPLHERARLKSRQGVRYIGQEGLEVVHQNNNTSTTNNLTPVPADGETVGEIVMRGNMTMKGYLKNLKANMEAFVGGWFHSGDLGVKHPDGYIEIKDRAKDIIISGGENISSLHVENVIYRHPDVLEVCVVARPDEKWGESPCAFITKKVGAADLSAEQIVDFCRANMPHFMVPKSIVFGPIPKTATGKIQKHVMRTRAKALGPIPSSRL